MDAGAIMNAADRARRVKLCDGFAREAAISYAWMVDMMETDRPVAAQFYRADAAHFYAKAMALRLELLAELPGSYPEG